MVHVFTPIVVSGYRDSSFSSIFREVVWTKSKDLHSFVRCRQLSLHEYIWFLYIVALVAMRECFCLINNQQYIITQECLTT